MPDSLSFMTRWGESDTALMQPHSVGSFVAVDKRVVVAEFLNEYFSSGDNLAYVRIREAQVYDAGSYAAAFCTRISYPACKRSRYPDNIVIGTTARIQQRLHYRRGAMSLFSTGCLPLISISC